MGERAKLWVKKDIEDRKNPRRYTEKIIDFRHIPCYNCIVWRVFMVVSMTIKNADDALKTDIKKWFEEHQDGYVVDYFEEYIDEIYLQRNK